MTVEKNSPRTEVLEKCPVCESKNTKLYFTSPDRLHGVAGEFGYHLCGKCKTVFQNPMVIQEDLHLCYPSEYTPYNYDPEMPEVSFEANGNHGFLVNSRNMLRQAIVKEVWHEPLPGVAGLAGKVLSKSRAARERAFYGIVLDECIPRERGKYFALDVGCGAGWMLKRLKQVGWQVEGIEWDKTAAEVAAERTGAKVWAGDFREIDLPENKYHLIFLSHVFEHFNDPLGALKRFYELLASQGKLVMIYPNPESLDSKWFDRDWFAWEVPRHLILP
ncbi:MAG TPA: class I SAM-dependent methyltransferase, partial [Pyrinomonadaceae bacterium]|nr:class I SAM-dependent methyltransferase [Pyrinomonadaceae bacterium]